MKIYSKNILLACMVFFIIPSSSFAGWQVAKPNSTIPREPFFQTGRTAQKVTYKGAYTTTTGVAPMAPVASHPVSAAYIPVAYKTNVYPRRYSHISMASPVYAVSISGSLKENLERIMGRYHWRVIWKAPYDYNFDGRITGSSLPSVIEKLLQPFPLQAVMYMSNRTLAIVPRNKT